MGTNTMKQAGTQISYGGGDAGLLHATVLEATEGDTKRPPLILLHGGGPDHHSMLPLARRLNAAQRVILPDIRGYGRSVCADPALHTWAQYVADITALLDCLRVEHAAVCGAGIGATIALRAAIDLPDRIAALILISIEDIEDDAAKAIEIELLDRFAEQVRTEGLTAAWEPILKHMAPIIGTLVRDAIPRSDPASIAAAAAIARDRSFLDVSELAVIQAPTLIFPGADFRHPTALAKAIAALLPQGQLAAGIFNGEINDSEDLGRALAPLMISFLQRVFGIREKYTRLPSRQDAGGLPG